MTGDVTGFSITIIGAMNPAIHHPAWYRRVGLLNSDAEGYAQLDPGLICSGDFSAFRTASLTINCHRDKWWIETRESELHQEVLEIVSRLFDEKLPETPVQGFELAFNYHITCGSKNVAQTLVAMMPISSWGVMASELDSGAFLIQSNRGSKQFTLRIEPSQRGPSMLYLGHSFRFGVTVPAIQEGRFSLRPLVFQGYLDALEYASRLTGQIVASVASHEG